MEPGEDRSLTADEARAWASIQQHLQLRARYRHRVVGGLRRTLASPIVVAGLLMALGGLGLAGAALLPRTAALAGALASSAVGLVVAVAGAVMARRRPKA